MRAMARRPDGSEQALVELKGVDAAYPLVGVRAALGRHVARRGASAASPAPPSIRSCSSGSASRSAIASRSARIEVPIRATIAAEPDKLTERLTVGPRVLVSLETLRSDRA